MPRDESKSRNLGPRHALGYALFALLVAVGFLAIGGGGTLAQRAMGVGRVLLASGWIPVIYLVGSFGWGRGCLRFARIIRRPDDRTPTTQWIITLGIGFVVNLSLDHLLGMLGWLGPISAWGISGAGVLPAIHDLWASAGRWRNTIESVRLNLIGASFVVGAVLVVVMSCNPPGVSWDSEFGGFDELSYHLELPRMWMETGRIWPSEQSVYSYLPGYVESAYVHLSALTGTMASSPDGTSALWHHGGQAAMATHLFSAFLVILCALAMGTLVGRMLDLFAPQHRTCRGVCVGSARAMMICLPWIVAVGTIAYNELAVVLLGISALAVAIEPDWPSTDQSDHAAHAGNISSATLRAGIAGVLVAGACCCKLTAIFLVAPSIVIVLLATIPPKQWLKPIAAGCVMGLLVLLPWMIRNQLATGNPVFPQAAGLFGEEHWSAAQHEIFSRAHHFDGSIMDRLRLLVLPDPDGQQHVSRFRGLTNLQWGLVPTAGIIGLGILLARSTSRRLGLVALAALVLPIVGWLMLTHLQSRFLVPIAPMFIAIALLGMASVPIARLPGAMMGIVAAGGAGWLVVLASMQSGGNPSLLIDLGPRVFLETGIVGDPPFSAVINDQLQADETVYLLGDATPIYVRSPMIWNTVYDHWLIEDAIAQAPTDPEAWNATLRDAGVDVVVVSFDEIGRYAQSGWLPESITETLNNGTMQEWINSLGEPIYTWEHPSIGQMSRAMFRLNTHTRTTP